MHRHDGRIPEHLHASLQLLLAVRLQRLRNVRQNGLQALQLAAVAALHGRTVLEQIHLARLLQQRIDVNVGACLLDQVRHLELALPIHQPVVHERVLQALLHLAVLFDLAESPGFRCRSVGRPIVVAVLMQRDGIDASVAALANHANLVAANGHQQRIQVIVERPFVQHLRHLPLALLVQFALAEAHLQAAQHAAVRLLVVASRCHRLRAIRGDVLAAGGLQLRIVAIVEVLADHAIDDDQMALAIEQRLVLVHAQTIENALAVLVPAVLPDHLAALRLQRVIGGGVGHFGFAHFEDELLALALQVVVVVLQAFENLGGRWKGEISVKHIRKIYA